MWRVLRPELANFRPMELFVWPVVAPGFCNSLGMGKFMPRSRPSRLEYPLLILILPLCMSLSFSVFCFRFRSPCVFVFQIAMQLGFRPSRFAVGIQGPVYLNKVQVRLVEMARMGVLEDWCPSHSGKALAHCTFYYRAYEHLPCEQYGCLPHRSCCLWR